MLRILLDQDFDHNILRGVLQWVPDVDYVSAFDAGIGRLSDSKLLLWAARKRRVLLTHDLKTMPTQFASLYDEGITLQGVIVVPRSLSMARSIEELAMIIDCS